MIPTVKNSLVVSGMSRLVAPTCWMRPMRKEPTTLTIRVP